jgi:hypothetical protein
MIRIDEIYCNTFLPRIQAKPLHGLHYFDPFGSVELKDLCSQPAVPGDPRAQRYLFWDQEPLHKETVDATLAEFKTTFNGTHHLITSERDSDAVQYACNTYGFVPHYYFFHGWAALDWYRGYDRSYLMTPPDERKITRTFISPNRIIAGKRNHRLIMLYHIFKYGMQNNWISCPTVCPAENISIQTAAEQVTHAYPDAVEVFDQQVLPMVFPGESGAPMHSAQLSLFKESAESLIYLVTETVAEGRRQHLTEKTFKPIALNMPFVIVGTRGSLAYLRSYGFRTFGHLWDESYDDELHDHQRIEKIAFTLKAMDILPADEKQRLFDMAKEICEYNYNHFYGGGFEKILWTEMEGMLNELGV